MSVAVGWFVNLTSLTDSTISFFTAFCLEALLFSVELWAKLPVGIVLVMILLLISWCVSTTLEAKADFSILSRVHDLKDRLVNFTRGPRGETSEPGSDAGDGGDDGSVMPTKPGALKEVLSRLRRSRGSTVSTSSTFVNQIKGGRCGPLDTPTMEMDGINNKESGGQV